MYEKILIVDDEPENLQLVSHILTREGFHVTALSSAREALNFLEKDIPHLIILDVMMPDIDGFQACRLIRQNSRTVHIPVLLLTALSGVEQRIKGFESGADVFISKPFEPEELLARVKVLLKRISYNSTPSKEDKYAKIISVFSMKGGTGVTTLCSNLAVGLAQLWDCKVALVDLVFSGGQAALFLNLPGKNSWEDLISTATADIDGEYLHMILREHKSGVKLLSAPPNPCLATFFTDEMVSVVLNMLSKDFDYIVLDLPNDFSGKTMTALLKSDMILTVLAPDLASVRSTRMAFSAFNDINIPTEIVHPVLNWTFEHDGILRADIQEILKKRIEWVIPYSPEFVVPSINLGIPIISGEPDSSIGQIFEDLSYVVSKDEHKKSRTGEPTTAWLRLARRVRTRKKK